MSDLTPEIFDAANVESDKILDWLTERDVPFEVAALALLITASGMIDRAARRATAVHRLGSRMSRAIAAPKIDRYERSVCGVASGFSAVCYKEASG